jgi:lysine 6-dehydrogenase
LTYINFFLYCYRNFNGFKRSTYDMRARYAIIGAGLQGTAAAYDFARFGNAAEIIIADFDDTVAGDAAEKVNRLTDTGITVAAQLDARDKTACIDLLEQVDCCLSAVPYHLNVTLTECAIEAKCHFCDLGRNTEVVFAQHDLDKLARSAGITIAPDCGLAPGMANILALYGINSLDKPRNVKIRVGGLPQDPKPPLGYHLSFNIEGLTNEYFGKAVILRNGKVTEVDTFTELETIMFPQPVGQCEAFMTHGGTSTCPWSFEGVLQGYDEKTVRYPGHYDKMKTIHELGLLDTEPVDINGQKIVPREVYHKVAEPKLQTGDPRDVVVVRVIVEADDEAVVIDLIDFYDPATGFTAMQRTTGFGAAIVGIMIAAGDLPAGSIRLEKSIDPDAYIEAMRLRGFDLKIRRMSGVEKQT